MQQFELIEYFHGELNKEVNAIGGRYLLTHEKKISVDGKEVLYLTGYALFDSTCCGAGGCTYAVVQGIIRNWKKRKDKSGNFVTDIIPIRDNDLQLTIKNQILKNEMVNQVVFI
jgi:hypothetical protein